MLTVKLALTLAGMSVIPHGSFAPLYATKNAERVSVSSFALDTEPATRGDFLQFVRRNPEWRRSAVKSSVADRGYLSDWRGDFSPGAAADLARPVTSISRNAAMAYCASKGKRLPTTEEWEYVAAASETRRDAVRDRKFIARLIGYYRARSGVRPGVVGKSAKNVYGVRDLHELAWEWTADPIDHHGNHEHHMFCASSAIGAADPSNYPAFMRYAVRSGLTDRTTLRTLGFRCAA
ncbi:MAG TPA: formylglycine-generating enzyme family protein [Gemmatimonadaceae bacterium]|nr:formylglycine-generating enzyme family protein [Gemmatimonadaceae bacterium]